MKNPILYIIIPCYNEAEVLPFTAPLFLSKIDELVKKHKISAASKIMFIDDGSKDNTWKLIKSYAEQNEQYCGLRQSRNRGHQYAVLAGLLEARNFCDVTISIDCDGQDDINAMNEMIDEYLGGCEIVYGVRNNRDTDSWFKRSTAEGFYKIMNWMGTEVVFNHADYRLVSSRVLNEFEGFKEVNIFLRGLFPLVGFKSTNVYYERHERIAGESHYPLKKMLALAFDGITSLSVRPIRIITGLGLFVSILSFIGVIWAIFSRIFGSTITGWASLICVLCFMSGIQLVCLGVLGEYIGKIYIETKARPRYIISERINIEENKSY